jgi:hypothetical protein
MTFAIFSGPTLEEVDRHINVLDHAEPYTAQDTWRPSFNFLRATLLGARRVRNYCTIPAAIIAALLVVLFHGDVWDWDDFRNLLGLEAAAIFGLRIAMSSVFAALEREDRLQTLLRYFGATDVILDEETTA